MNASSPSIELKDVSFQYPVFERSSRSLRMTLLHQVTGARIVEAGGHVAVQALSDVNIKIERGQRVGLIGRNGSGKSTLLRIIAGLAHPQKGECTVTGTRATVIDRGLGLNIDLTGYQNIELPLRLLGATTEEVREAQREIPEWTQLGDFIHMPMRTYSEGMKARLMFAICTALKRDIFILDEWFSAGDANFVDRAHDRVINYMNDTGIVVLASHSNEIIRWLCDVAVWLDKGQVRAVGKSGDVLDQYLEETANKPDQTADAPQIRLAR